jgi:hypothetical protein
MTTRAPFWDACDDNLVWRTIGEGSWSGEFTGKQTIINEIFRPLNRVLVERQACLPHTSNNIFSLSAHSRSAASSSQACASTPRKRAVGLAGSVGAAMSQSSQ